MVGLTDEIQAVNDALYRARGLNAWIPIYPQPRRGAIGYLVQRELYEYLTGDPDRILPRGQAAICLFHRNYKPRQYEEYWKVAKANHPIYDDPEMEAGLSRVCELIVGQHRVITGRGMEVANWNLLDQIGYKVASLKPQGAREQGLDVVGRLDGRGDDFPLTLGLQAKTTQKAAAIGYSKPGSNRPNQLSKSLDQARDIAAVRKRHKIIDEADGIFDLVVVANRQINEAKLHSDEGWFYMPALEIS